MGERRYQKANETKKVTYKIQGEIKESERKFGRSLVMGNSQIVFKTLEETKIQGNT